MALSLFRAFAGLMSSSNRPSGRSLSGEPGCPGRGSKLDPDQYATGAMRLSICWRWAPERGLIVTIAITIALLLRYRRRDGGFVAGGLLKRALQGLQPSSPRRP